MTSVSPAYLRRRPHPAEMPRAKEGQDQRAKAEARPFEHDVRPFGRKLEQKREADQQIEKSPQHIDDG